MRIKRSNFQYLVLCTLFIGALFVQQKGYMSTYVFGSSSDQMPLLWHMWWESSDGQSLNKSIEEILPTTQGTSYTNYYFLNQPILRHILKILVSIFGVLPAFNLLVITSFILLILFSYLLFKSVGIHSKVVALAFSFLYACSPYMFRHQGVHIDLTQLWLIPLGMVSVFSFLKNSTPRKFVTTSLILISTCLISNYYGYVLIIFSFCYFVTYALYQKRATFFNLILKYSLLVIVVSIVSGFLLLWSLNISLTQLTAEYTSESPQGIIVKRGLEDFITFSSRPWHYLLPPSNHLIWGHVTTSFNDWLSSTKDHFLFRNYFPAEHDGSFIGILIFFTSLYYIITNWRKSAFTGRISLTLFFLLIFSMPPVVGIGGHLFYTPSYLLMKIFPMFRVLSRFSVVTTLLFMILAARGLEKIIKNKSFSDNKMLVLSIFFIIAFVEYLTPFDYTKLDTPPVYLWLRDQPGTIIMEYPYSATNEALFWQSKHHQALINPIGLKNSYLEFDSEIFTDNFSIKDIKADLEVLDRYLVEYVIVHQDKLEEEGITKDIFNHPSFVQWKDFGSTVVYKYKST